VAGASSTQTAALCQRPDDHSKTDFFNTIGASRPFRLVLANVPSPNRQQPFAAGDNLLGQAVSL
jgi:hypothetical protein